MTQRNWRVPARIETERLVLRCYQPEDAALMDEVIPANREHLLEFMVWARDEPIGAENRALLVERFIAGYKDGTEYTMGIFTRDCEEYIGGTGFHVREDHLEIGYWIAAASEGQGLVTEAAGALTRVALQFAFAPFVAICCDPANARSRGIPQRLGYEQAGMKEVDGLPHEFWRLSTDAFLDSPASAEPRPQVFDGIGSPLAWPV
jgi:RimJ/RimL family protein N-acetyltransferase